MCGADFSDVECPSCEKFDTIRPDEDWDYKIEGTFVCLESLGGCGQHFQDKNTPIKAGGG